MCFNSSTVAAQMNVFSVLLFLMPHVDFCRNFSLLSFGEEAEEEEEMVNQVSQVLIYEASPSAGCQLNSREIILIFLQEFSLFAVRQTLKTDHVCQ